LLELILAVSAVIIISGMCSLFEAVLLSTPVSQVEKLAGEGKASGVIFRDLRSNVDRPLSAILSLNTIANTGGAAVAGAAFVKVFGASWEVLFTVFITLAVLIISEVIPKTVGAVYNHVLFPVIARPLRALVILFKPVIACCGIITRAIARGSDHTGVSADEMISLSKLGARAGTLVPEEAQVIQNMLGLKTKTAKEVMTPRIVVFAMSDQLTVKEALGEGSSWRVSRAPVYAEDFEDIVGIVLRDEALEALAEGRTETRLHELMRSVHFVPETMKLDQILEMFLKRRQHLFVVLDEYGGLSGILTLEDVMEEILGKEIMDEVDQVTDLRALARKRRRDTRIDGPEKN
jgi:CBS domain containing-hemolysin-like protein